MGHGNTVSLQGTVAGRQVDIAESEQAATAEDKPELKTQSVPRSKHTPSLL
jgi:hypothetical protein